MLSARLHELIDQGVVHREVRPTSPPSAEYSLTSLGQELVPAIEAIVMESGRRFRGRVFIDATYEGDVMAKAGVKYLGGGPKSLTPSPRRTRSGENFSALCALRGLGVRNIYFSPPCEMPIFHP